MLRISPSISTGTSLARLLVSLLAVISCTWIALTPHTPESVYWVAVWSMMLSLILVAANLVLAALPSGHRLRHVGVVASLVVVMAFWWTSAGWHAQKRHAWFLQNELAGYEALAQKVMLHPEALTSNPNDMERVIHRPLGGAGWTNADGSVTIMFPGRDESTRFGYFYYSGTGQPTFDRPVYHLTNGWYEY